MEGRSFFSSRFIGMTITFTEPTHSVWTLVTKTEEDNSQSPAGNIGTSIAWALFTCHNPHNHNEEALVRIYMQIPNSGTEFELPHQRAQQAKPELDSIAEGELDAITRLTNVGAQHAPTIIGKRQGIQSDSGMVPGGFVLYLAMTKLRGRRLSDGIIEDSLFWRLAMTTRDLIREAFKIAYQDLLDADIAPVCEMKNLILEGPSEPRDGSEVNIYFADFVDADHIGSSRDRAWHNVFFILWGLAMPPKPRSGVTSWYQDDFDDTSMDEWGL